MVCPTKATLASAYTVTPLASTCVSLTFAACAAVEIFYMQLVKTLHGSPDPLQLALLEDILALQ